MLTKNENKKEDWDFENLKGYVIKQSKKQDEILLGDTKSAIQLC